MWRGDTLRNHEKCIKKNRQKVIMCTISEIFSGFIWRKTEAKNIRNGLNESPMDSLELSILNLRQLFKQNKIGIFGSYLYITHLTYSLHEQTPRAKIIYREQIRRISWNLHEEDPKNRQIEYSLFDTRRLMKNQRSANYCCCFSNDLQTNMEWFVVYNAHKKTFSTVFCVCV